MDKASGFPGLAAEEQNKRRNKKKDIVELEAF